MNCHHVEALKTMELDEVIWKKVNIFKKQKKRTQAHGDRNMIINGITEKQKVKTETRTMKNRKM